MLNKLILISLFGFLFPNNSDCEKAFFKFNESALISKFLHIKAYLNNSYKDSLNIYIQKNKKIKLELNNRIIIIDTNKTMNYNPSNNQLFIDKPDFLLSNWLRVEDDYQLINYFFNHENFNDSSILFYNNDCSKIDSIFIVLNQIDIKLYNVLIDSISILKPDSFFNLNIDEKNIFKYDFR